MCTCRAHHLISLSTPGVRGRFGVVRECRENATGKIYLAKIVPYSQESKQEVLKEYEILKGLHSEKIMALHEAYVTPRYLVLVAEFCSGKELLHSLIDRWELHLPPDPGSSFSSSSWFNRSNMSLFLKGSATLRMTWWATLCRSCREWSISTAGVSSTWI